MSLNKQKGNMYGFITHTWNPLIGKCPHDCQYCSTNKFYYPELIKRYSGKPRLDEKALKENLGKGNFIFVCAQNDLFAEEIPTWAIEKVFKHIIKFDNNYLVQTKNPERMQKFMWDSDKFCLEKIKPCTTIETNRIYKDFIGNAPSPKDRALGIGLFEGDRFVTIEPIMDFDLKEFVGLIKLCMPTQVNIGANSYTKIKLPEPPKEKVQELIYGLSQFTKVYIKDNLRRIITAPKSGK